MDEEIKVNGEPALFRLNGGYEFRREGVKKKVGVIGAGPAGLAALRRILEADMDVICFEQGPQLGGLWNYTEKTGKDDTGTSLHAFIYRDLKTNLPKEVMMFPDFPYHELEESYIHYSEVLKYLNNYAKEHDLEKHIKLRHRVINLKPYSNCWSLTALDLSSKQGDEHVYRFDAIFICSGPNMTPLYPQIELAKFSGHQIHSKEYRVPEVYQDKRILIIGLGPSGMDLAYQLNNFCKHIWLSTNREKVNISMPKNVTLKPEVRSVEDKTVTFIDGTTEDVDSIIHCTGYTFHFPFLDSECGVTVDQFVFPLYKQFISIEKPTLFFIGLPRLINHLFMCDYQVRTAVKSLKKEINLPSKEEMMEELKQDMNQRQEHGQKKHNFHNLPRDLFQQYFKDLSELGELEPVPQVQIALFKHAHWNSITNFANFRKYVYRIKSEDEFEYSLMEEPTDQNDNGTNDSKSECDTHECHTC